MKRHYYYVFINSDCDSVFIFSATSLKCIHHLMHTDYTTFIHLASFHMDSRHLDYDSAYLRSLSLVHSDQISFRYCY